jgi:hypothetical protein
VEKFWKSDDENLSENVSAEMEFCKMELCKIVSRIKMCTTITHYFMEYKHLPFVYREASNPGAIRVSLGHVQKHFLKGKIPCQI